MQRFLKLKFLDKRYSMSFSQKNTQFSRSFFDLNDKIPRKHNSCSLKYLDLNILIFKAKNFQAHAYKIFSINRFPSLRQPGKIWFSSKHLSFTFILLAAAQDYRFKKKLFTLKILALVNISKVSENNLTHSCLTSFLIAS